MEFTTTRQTDRTFRFCETVLRGLAPDGGLFVPQRVPLFDRDFFDGISAMRLHELAFRVLEPLIGDSIGGGNLREITEGAFTFDIPIVEVEPGIYALELFHGPTLAFKDVGARCFGRMLPRCGRADEQVMVLTATSGDTGGAVANGLYGIPGVDAVIFYPKGKVAPLQELQFATLGGNIYALAVEGDFDDCQRLVKEAFADEELCSQLNLTTANSINTARWLPQAVYYFWMYGQIQEPAVVSVPSGNFGNVTAGLLAHLMGVPMKRVIAACNANDTVVKYLENGVYQPQKTVHTVANAMDVGNPSNFERLSALFGHEHENVVRHVEGYSYTDDEILGAIRACYDRNGYLLDPHGACGYLSLKSGLQAGEQGVFLATAHPAKFSDVYSSIGFDEPKHEVLESLRGREVVSRGVSSRFEDVREVLVAI